MKYTKEEQKQRKAITAEAFRDLRHGRSAILNPQQVRSLLGQAVVLIICGAVFSVAVNFVPVRFEPLMALSAGACVGVGLMIVVMATSYEVEARWNTRVATPGTPEADLSALPSGGEGNRT